MFNPFKAFGAGTRSAPSVAAGQPAPTSSWHLDQLAIGVPGGDTLVTLDTRIEAGRVTAIVGPNGAGKSSLLSTMTGQWQPHGGQLYFDGLPLSRWTSEQLAQRRAMMMQDGGVAFDFTVQEVVELGRYTHRLRPSTDEAGIVARAMALTEVSQFAERSVRTLSGGERARTHLARVLAQLWEPAACGGARWLLLDEPTAAMDLAWQHQTMALLWERAHSAEAGGGAGLGVIAVVHDMNLALRYADDVLLVHGGNCLHGPVQEVLTPEVIARVWGVGCYAAQAPDGTAQYLFAQH